MKTSEITATMPVQDLSRAMAFYLYKSAFKRSSQVAGSNPVFRSHKNSLAEALSTHSVFGRREGNTSVKPTMGTLVLWLEMASISPSNYPGRGESSGDFTQAVLQVEDMRTAVKK